MSVIDELNQLKFAYTDENLTEIKPKIRAILTKYDFLEGEEIKESFKILGDNLKPRMKKLFQVLYTQHLDCRNIHLLFCLYRYKKNQFKYLSQILQTHAHLMSPDEILKFCSSICQNKKASVYQKCKVVLPFVHVQYFIGNYMATCGNNDIVTTFSYFIQQVEKYQKLLKKYKKLKAKVNYLEYSPEPGPKYLAAKVHFEKISK